MTAPRCRTDALCVRAPHAEGLHWYGQDEALVETQRKRIEVLEGALRQVKIEADKGVAERMTVGAATLNFAHIANIARAALGGK